MNDAYYKAITAFPAVFASSALRTLSVEKHYDAD